MELTFTLFLPREVSSVPFVRHLLRATLDRLGVEDACIHDIELALSEACTNVLRHALEAEDQYEVFVQIDNERCKLTVTDAGGGFDHAAIRRDDAATVSESGRGIHLMRALVDDLHFTSEGSGTVVQLSKTLELRPSSPLRQRPRAVEGDGDLMPERERSALPTQAPKAHPAG